jgi:hypothetical protein
MSQKKTACLLVFSSQIFSVWLCTFQIAVQIFFFVSSDSIVLGISVGHHILGKRRNKQLYTATAITNTASDSRVSFLLIGILLFLLAGMPATGYGS